MSFRFREIWLHCLVGTLQWGYQIPRHASDEAVPRYGAAFRGGENGRGSSASLCNTQVGTCGVLRFGD